LICCIALRSHYKRKNEKPSNYNHAVGNASPRSPSTHKENSSNGSDGTAQTASSIAMTSMNMAMSSSNGDFEANLSNLSGANNLLMDDIVGDMNGNDDDVITAGGHVTAGGPDINDLTESVHQGVIEGTYADDTIIGGLETMGAPENGEEMIYENDMVDNIISYDDDNDIIDVIETMGGPDDDDHDIIDVIETMGAQYHDEDDGQEIIDVIETMGGHDDDEQEIIPGSHVVYDAAMDEIIEDDDDIEYMVKSGTFGQ